MINARMSTLAFVHFNISIESHTEAKELSGYT